MSVKEFDSYCIEDIRNNLIEDAVLSYADTKYVFEKTHCYISWNCQFMCNCWINNDSVMIYDSPE